jgi:hypothetical protein
LRDDIDASLPRPELWIWMIKLQNNKFHISDFEDYVMMQIVSYGYLFIIRYKIGLPFLEICILIKIKTVI